MEPPDQARKSYATEIVDGVTVYYPPGLVLYGPAIRISLGGFWIFKWLKLEGVAPVEACAV